LKEGKNPVKARVRVSRINKFILIVALLWIATTVALLWEAQPRQSVHRVIGTSGHLKEQARSVVVLSQRKSV
jgi:hypothetical protein